MAEKKFKKKQSSVNEEALLALEGRVPPHDLKIEESVLGALLLEQDSFGRIAEILSPEVFYAKKHQLIYEAILKLASNDTPHDILSVSVELNKMGVLEDIGGEAFLGALTATVFSTSSLAHHAQVLVDKYTSRKLISLSSEIITNAYDESLDVKDQVEAAGAKLFEISQNDKESDFEPLPLVISTAITEIKNAANQKDGLSGITSGFEDIDKMTSGWQKSDLVIIAARPAMGKTAFVLSMAKNIAVDYKIPVAVFNLEMSSVQLGKRLISNVCEISNDSLKSGKLSTDEWGRLSETIKVLDDAPLYINDTPSLSVFQLRSQARWLVKDKGVQMIIIDYLQLMNASGMGFGNREQEVSIISRSLKTLAKELKIPIIALSQLNRGVENRTGDKNSKRPQLSDLRESGAIEQDADMVCFIHRPEYYQIFQDEEGRDLHGVGEFIIAKHRNGPVGDVRLDFLGEYTRFQTRDAAKDEIVAPETGETTKRTSFNKAVGQNKGKKGQKPTSVASVPIKTDDKGIPF